MPIGKDAGQLKAFFAELDREERYMLLLHHVDGLTPREISAVLDVSLGHVHHRLLSLARRLHDAAVHTPAEVS